MIISKNIYNPKKNKLYFGILLSLIVSYFGVRIFAEKIFLAGTPQLNPSLIAAFQTSPFQGLKYVASLEGLSLFGSASDVIETAKIPRVSPREGLSYVPIAKGVQAAENPEREGRFIKIEQGTKFEIRTVKLSDGREVKVYIPLE